jgi:hypothetical protein
MTRALPFSTTKVEQHCARHLKRFAGVHDAMGCPSMASSAVSHATPYSGSRGDFQFDNDGPVAWDPSIHPLKDLSDAPGIDFASIFQLQWRPATPHTRIDLICGRS